MKKNPFVIGITGSIGMGKSTVSSQFTKFGAIVHDADKSVHKIYQSKETIDLFKNIFPSSIVDGKINREALSKLVLQDKANLKKIENIIHPLVKQDRERFIKLCRRNRRKLVIFDIPLLYESGADSECDIVIVVSSPLWLQKARVFRRDKSMTEEKFKAILMRQMPDYIKRRKADIVIKTSLGKAYTMKRVKQCLAHMCGGKK